MSKNQKNHQNVLEIAPNFGQNEQGRSMVEMLGVLAVIGVLSVGAISGYRYAMNKYRANQVLNELNLLSHQVAIALMSKNGVTELKLGEPYDLGKLTSGYAFEAGCGESADKTETCSGKTTYSMKVSNLPQSVCTEVKKQSHYLQYMNSAAGDCSLADVNMLMFRFGTEQSPLEAYDKETDTLAETTALPETTTRTTTTATETESTTTTTVTESGTESVFETTTTPTFIEGGVCYQNDDCQDDQYCKNITCGFSCTQEFGQHEGFDPVHGECHSIGLDTETVNVSLNGGPTKTYKVSTHDMTWWSANRFCDRQDGSYHLVSLSDLGCSATTCSAQNICTAFNISSIYWIWSVGNGSAACEVDSIDCRTNNITSFNRGSTAGRAICVE